MKNKSYTTIEEDLLLLSHKCNNHAISLREILSILSEKGLSLIILFLSLPFCQPLQIPGLSTPFGLAIAFIGLKMAFGNYVWLPKRILAKSINAHTLQKITNNILWLVKKMKRWVHPRMIYLCHSTLFQIINGFLLFLLGICLAMPLPIPFSNLLAAWSIFFIGFGSLEDDGVFILIGYLISFCTFIFFISTILALKYLI